MTRTQELKEREELMLAAEEAVALLRDIHVRKYCPMHIEEEISMLIRRLRSALYGDLH